jgi:cytidylate kinase
MGSLGKDVVAQVALQLGKKVIHHEIVDQLADKLRLRKTHVVRFIEGKAGLLEKMSADHTSLSIFTADEILRIAASGDVGVIRGWGATHLLESIPHVMRLRVCASFDVRVKRMMERLNTSDQAAVEKEIRLSEEAITAITRRHFDVDWTDAEHYDLILNTDRVSVEDCTAQVMQMISTPRFAETPESLRKLQDLALVASVRAALRGDERTRKLKITIEVSAGHATLSGIVETEPVLKLAAEVAATVAGITGVTNQLGEMSSAYRRFAN